MQMIYFYEGEFCEKCDDEKKLNGRVQQNYVYKIIVVHNQPVRSKFTVLRIK